MISADIGTAHLPIDTKLPKDRGFELAMRQIKKYLAEVLNEIILKKCIIAFLLFF